MPNNMNFTLSSVDSVPACCLFLSLSVGLRERKSSKGSKPKTRNQRFFKPWRRYVTINATWKTKPKLFKFVFCSSPQTALNNPLLLTVYHHVFVSLHFYAFLCIFDRTPLTSSYLAYIKDQTFTCQNSMSRHHQSA